MAEAILVKGTRPVDITPTSGSSNLITSGGVKNALDNAVDNIVENISSPPEVHVGTTAPTGEEVVWFNPAGSNAANIMITNEALQKDAVLYVATSGNDETGNGSEEAPYATVTKAVNEVPKNLNGNNATINVASGTYNEAVNISNFSNGEIIIKGATENVVDNVTISNINIINSTYVAIDDMNLTTNNIHESNSVVYTNGNVIISDAIAGIELEKASKFITAENTELTINNATVAIKSKELSQAYIDKLVGNDEDGLIAESGSTIVIGANELTVNRTLYSTSSGATISVNTQPTLANF